MKHNIWNDLAWHRPFKPVFTDYLVLALWAIFLIPAAVGLCIFIYFLFGWPVLIIAILGIIYGIAALIESKL